MKDLKKYYIIPAPPEELFLALTNPLTILLWSGEPAEMSAEVGAEFSLFEGNICGKNVEIEQDKKIVQQWYFEGQSDSSIVTIKLHPHPKGTSVELRHTNIPDQDYDNMEQGWDEYYWGALEEFYTGE